MKDDQRKQSTARKANAYVVVVIALFFIVHALLGLAEVTTPWRGALEWMVWIGVALIAVHVVLCGVTTYQMWFDTQRPASSKKKRHQKYKWATGIVLCACLSIHIATGGLPLQAPSLPCALVGICILASLAWHFCVGAKSLARDLRAPKEARTPLRIAMIACTTLLGISLLIIEVALL